MDQLADLLETDLGFAGATTAAQRLSGRRSILDRRHGAAAGRGQQITLNYVSPDARFRGISRGMLGALEARAAERGNTRCRLTSTETARRFYLGNGYAEQGPPVLVFGTRSGYPMSRALAFAVKFHKGTKI